MLDRVWRMSAGSIFYAKSGVWLNDLLAWYVSLNVI